MKKRHYNKLFNFFVLTFYLFVFTGCWHLVDDVIISDKKCVLTKAARIFLTPKTISRNRETASILVFIQNGYSYRDGLFKLHDGRVFNIKVTLIDDNGIRHDTQYYGQIGAAYAASFDGLEKNLNIISVEITSTIDIPCERIVWHCFTPFFG